MTDIVERLRSYSAGGIEADKQAEDWMDESADEIERLREALREIASIDYRGNAHPSASIAHAALKEKE